MPLLRARLKARHQGTKMKMTLSVTLGGRLETAVPYLLPYSGAG